MGNCCMCVCAQGSAVCRFGIRMVNCMCVYKGVLFADLVYIWSIVCVCMRECCLQIWYTYGQLYVCV